MVDCEFCGKKITPDALGMGVCPSCQNPISPRNQEALKQEGGIMEDSGPAIQVSPPADVATELKECQTCGNPMPPDQYDVGVPCPQCNNDPRQPEKPPTDRKKDKEDDSGEVDEEQIPEPSKPKGIVKLEVSIGTGLGKILEFPLDEELGRQEFLAAAGKEISGIEYISSKHLKFTETKGMLYVTDLGSRNGTRVNYDSCTPNIPRELTYTDRLILSNGGIILRVIEYDDAKTSLRKDILRIRDEDTGVMYIINVGATSEMIGRKPDNGEVHPLIEDIYHHKISVGEEKNRVTREVEMISRKHFEIRMANWNPHQSGIPEVITFVNYSQNGTKVNETNLASDEAKIELTSEDLPIIVNIRDVFKWHIESSG